MIATSFSSHGMGMDHADSTPVANSWGVSWWVLLQESLGPVVWKCLKHTCWRLQSLGWSPNSPPNKKKSRETIVLTIQIWTKPHRFSLAPWDTIPGYPVSSLGQNAVHLVLGTRMRTNQDGVCHGMSPNNVWVQKIGEAYQSYHTQDILWYTQHTWRVSQFSSLFRSLAKAIWS